MIINKCNIVCFSPTRTSFKIAEAVSKGTGIDEVINIDVTYSVVNSHEINNNELAIFAVPVYGGHIPTLLKERFSNISGNGTPAVVIVVYGNRDYEMSLRELADLVKENGFNVIAAGTFVGEHSYSTDKYPIAVNRPDASDIYSAIEFGEQIKTKFLHVQGKIPNVDVSKISRPHQSLIKKIRFIYKVISFKKSKRPIARTPSVLDVSKCTHCGKCVSVCPNNAIALGNETTTIEERCIRCCACVKACPQNARSYETPFSIWLSQYFSDRKDPRTII